MRRIGRNSFTEIYFAGCNPSYVETSDGYVMIDSPQQPIGFVETQVDRGIGPEEILKGPVPVTKQDPYPIGQRLFVHDERLTGMIVHNLHSRILAKKAA